MKRTVAIVIGFALSAAIGFVILTSPEMVRAGLEPIPAGQPDLANGRTMFYAGGCASCHATPDQDDKTRLGGGLALHSPFGTFYAPNISPHPRDGIGGWTPEQFLRAMREGVSPEGRHYYPAFPYTSYQRMAPADLRDLFAFIKTVPPVEGRVRDHDLPFPFNIRRGFGLWKLAFLDGAGFRARPRKSAELESRRYLVEGPGHCAECHIAAQLRRRHRRRTALCRRPEPGREGRGSQHHAGSDRHRRLVQERHRRAAEDRLHAEVRHGRRLAWRGRRATRRNSPKRTGRRWRSILQSLPPRSSRRREGAAG